MCERARLLSQLWGGRRAMLRHVIVLDISLGTDHDLKSLTWSLVTSVLGTMTTQILTQSHRILRQHTFQDPSIDSSFCRPFLSHIISFLLQLQHHLFFSSNSHFFSIRVGMPLPLPSCCIFSLGQKGLLHNWKFPVWSPSNPWLFRVTVVSRGNSASKNLQEETQWPKCCLYETPYVAAPIRETGDVVARTPTYMGLPTDAPTRARFFWFMRNAFLKRPIPLNYWLLCPFFLWGSHMQKQYQERTTLRTWPWKTQGRDTEWSAPTIAHHIHSASVPLGMTVAQRYDVRWDWLWDACHMAGVHWGTGCKGFCSKEGPHYNFEQSMRKLSYDKQQSTFFTSLDPLGIPYPSCTALLSKAYVTWESGAQGFLWVRKMWFVFFQRRFAPETFSERQKGERSPVVSLYQVPASVLLQEIHAFCAKNMGAHVRHTTSECQRYQKMGQEIGFLCSRERRKELSK